MEQDLVIALCALTMMTLSAVFVVLWHDARDDHDARAVRHG